MGDAYLVNRFDVHRVCIVLLDLRLEVGAINLGLFRTSMLVFKFVELGQSCHEHPAALGRFSPTSLIDRTECRLTLSIWTHCCNPPEEKPHRRSSQQRWRIDGRHAANITHSLPQAAAPQGPTPPEWPSRRRPASRDRQAPADRDRMPRTFDE